MKITRRNFILGVLPTIVFGCNNDFYRYSSVLEPQIRNNASYKLEDLCDTGLYKKEINLSVYIKDSKLLWEYHQYKEEIFSYVKDFFRENNIDVHVSYSDTKLKGFNSPTEFGYEIHDSKREKEERYYQLYFGIKRFPENLGLDLRATSHAVTPAQIGFEKSCKTFLS